MRKYTVYTHILYIYESLRRVRNAHMNIVINLYIAFVDIIKSTDQCMIFLGGNILYCIMVTTVLNSLCI